MKAELEEYCTCCGYNTFDKDDRLLCVELATRSTHLWVSQSPDWRNDGSGN